MSTGIGSGASNDVTRGGGGSSGGYVNAPSLGALAARYGFSSGEKAQGGNGYSYDGGFASAPNQHQSYAAHQRALNQLYQAKRDRDLYNRQQDTDYVGALGNGFLDSYNARVKQARKDRRGVLGWGRDLFRDIPQVNASTLNQALNNDLNLGVEEEIARGWAKTDEQGNLVEDKWGKTVEIAEPVMSFWGGPVGVGGTIIAQGAGLPVGFAPSFKGALKPDIGGSNILTEAMDVYDMHQSGEAMKEAGMYHSAPKTSLAENETGQTEPSTDMSANYPTQGTGGNDSFEERAALRKLIMEQGAA